MKENNRMYLLKSHIAKYRVNGYFSYRTLCGKIVGLWSVVNIKHWWHICKTCRKRNKAIFAELEGKKP